jgi:predicted N-acetyltransferase YhbS
VYVDPAHTASNTGVRFEEPGDIEAVRLIYQKAFGRDSERRIVEAGRGGGRAAAASVAVMGAVEGVEDAPAAGAY